MLFDEVGQVLPVYAYFQFGQVFVTATIWCRGEAVATRRTTCWKVSLIALNRDELGTGRGVTLAK